MRVLLAGATGAIGSPLICGLKQHGHSVFGLVRSTESTHTLAEMYAEDLIGDALDAAAVRAAIFDVREMGASMPEGERIPCPACKCAETVAR